MSFIYRDFLTPSRLKWNTASSLYHRFNRVWGKETIDGIQVYNSRMNYWGGHLRSDKPFKRFINALGVEYATLQNAKYEGVDNVYFKLEPNKYRYTAPEKKAIAEDLNSVFNVGDEFEVYVHYTGESKRVVKNHYILRAGSPIGSTDIKDYAIDKNVIRATLESNPILYFANASVQPAGELNVSAIRTIRAVSTLILNAIRRTPKATPVTVVEYDNVNGHIYQTLAVLDNGSVFQKMGISSEIVTIKKSSDTMVWYEYSYKVKYKVVAEATSSSYVVGQIDIVTNAIQSSLIINNGNLAVRVNGTLDTNLKEAAFQMNNVEAVGLTYNGQLRVDAVANMKRLEFMDMLGKILGTGYTKKKSKWYEKALAIVIVVIAVVIGVLTGGAGAIAAGNLVAIGTALGVAATVATVGMMMYAAAFPYATDGVKMIGRFAQIVGLGAMVTGVFAAIQQSWTAYTKDLAAKQLATGATEQQASAYAASNANIGGYVKYLFDSAVNSISTQVSSISDKFTSFFDKAIDPSSWSVSNIPTMNDVSGWIGNMNDALKMYMKFFGDKPDELTSAESEQATKEDGVEAYYASVAMLDEVDALHRLDFMIKNNNGGQMTENYMVKIT